MCYGTVPSIIDSDNDGYPVVRVDNIAPQDIPLAELAVSICPERALSLQTLREREADA
jgi:ferredoxin